MHKNCGLVKRFVSARKLRILRFGECYAEYQDSFVSDCSRIWCKETAQNDAQVVLQTGTVLFPPNKMFSLTELIDWPPCLFAATHVDYLF